jgi:GNAT superfamily N-acetyltransferase
MKIRSAKTSDKETVLEFCKNTFSWGDYIADVWNSWQSKGKLYVTEVDDKVVGAYNIALFEKEAWIEGMRVDPQYRRKGLGKLMLAHAESVIPNKVIRLIIESKNTPSIQLAGSMGYYLEDKWRLYSTLPEKQDSSVKITLNIAEAGNLINTVTYADSWKWLPLDREELQKLVNQKRVVISVNAEKLSAVGIWNISGDFPRVFQIGYLNGINTGMVNILRHAQNKAQELNCERIQIFVQEKIPIEEKFLDKRSLFYLMRKDTKKNL